MKARLFVCLTAVSVLCAGGRAKAGPWSAQPLVGVVAEYASNPLLLAQNPRSETHAALILDLPVYYDLDALHFAVTPRVRYGGDTGYSSVTSNYYHLDATAQYKSELDSFAFTGALYRDSSLLYAGELANGVGVRRDTSSGDLNWQHNLSERLQFQLDGNTQRTLYGQSEELSGLVDYRYTNLSPAIVYALDERDSMRFLGSVGRYYSLNGFTASDSSNLQLGIDRKLSELWTLSATAGYSKSTNQYDFGFATFKNDETGSVYSINLKRQTERLALIASVSQALAPTGGAFLSRQQSVNLSANYQYSERWAFTAAFSWANLSDPVIGGGSTDRRYYSADLSALWHWTEQWLVTMHATKLTQQYGPPDISATSSGVSLQISRQFYRTNN